MYIMPIFLNLIDDNGAACIIRFLPAILLDAPCVFVRNALVSMLTGVTHLFDRFYQKAVLLDHTCILFTVAWSFLRLLEYPKESMNVSEYQKSSK